MVRKTCSILVSVQFHLNNGLCTLVPLPFRPLPFLPLAFGPLPIRSLTTWSSCQIVLSHIFFALISFFINTITAYNKWHTESLTLILSKQFKVCMFYTVQRFLLQRHQCQFDVHGVICSTNYQVVTNHTLPKVCIALMKVFYTLLLKPVLLTLKGTSNYNLNTMQQSQFSRSLSDYMYLHCPILGDRWNVIVTDVTFTPTKVHITPP